MSFSRWRKDSEGGRREPILKTFGSTRSLWPLTGLSLLVVAVFWLMPERLWDLETRPGTEDWRIWSRSRWSEAKSADFSSISDNLNTRYHQLATDHTLVRVPALFLSR